MSVSTVHLGAVAEESALISLPVEDSPADSYLPIDARIVLFGNTLPAFIPALQAGLVSVSATLVSGKTVQTAADTIQWCLEALQTATGD